MGDMYYGDWLLRVKFGTSQLILFDPQRSSFPEFANFLWYLMNVRHFVDEILELVVMVSLRPMVQSKWSETGER